MQAPRLGLWTLQRRWKRCSYVVPLASFLAACSAPDTRGIHLIGHGGLGPDAPYPMNSEEAFQGALEQGLNGVEIDVQLTKDSQLVAHHDHALNSHGCTGRIHDHTWSELQGCIHPAEAEGAFHGVLVPTLIEELQRLHPDARFTLDVKLNSGSDWWLYLHATARAIARMHEQAGSTNNLTVECRTPDFLRAMAESAPGIPYHLITEDVSKELAHAVELGCAGITVQADALDADEVAAIREAGLALTLYGVGDPWSLKRAVAFKPEAIQVDR
jgi:glycerophosphoryl diester phosphodiesterase